jgi:segregation and condensation protein B
MTPDKLKNIIEAVLLSAEHPMTVQQIESLFMGDNDCPSRDDLRKALHDLGEDYDNRGFELKQVASGYRLQVKQDFAEWVGRLWEEKPARYSRALLETIALIAYRQPVTRGEIEDVRGVSVSSNIIKTLVERDWVKVLGHKDVPGKPALYGTTREFLDYFNLKSLDELPTLADIKDLDKFHPELELDDIAGSDEIDQSEPDEVAIADEASGSENEEAIAEAAIEDEEPGSEDDESIAEATLEAEVSEENLEEEGSLDEEFDDEDEEDIESSVAGQ